MYDKGKCHRQSANAKVNLFRSYDECAYSEFSRSSLHSNSQGERQTEVHVCYIRLNYVYIQLTGRPQNFSFL